MAGADGAISTASSPSSAGSAVFSRRAGAEDEQASLSQWFAFQGSGPIVAPWGEVAGQYLNGAALAAQQGAQHLLLQRGMKAADQHAARLGPVRHALQRFDKNVAGALARGDEGQQWFGQQCRVADADEVCCLVCCDAWGEVGWQRDEGGFHASSSVLSSKLVLTVCA